MIIIQKNTPCPGDCSESTCHPIMTKEQIMKARRVMFSIFFRCRNFPYFLFVKWLNPLPRVNHLDWGYIITPMEKHILHQGHWKREVFQRGRSKLKIKKFVSSNTNNNYALNTSFTIKCITPDLDPSLPCPACSF